MVESEETKQAKLPDELRKFNLGAFFLTWIWGIFHRVWIALFVLVIALISYVLSNATGLFYVVQPLAGLFILGYAIFLGFKGNELAWKTGRYNDIETYKKTEKKWATAGTIVFVSLSILGAIFLVGAISSASLSLTGSVNTKNAKKVQAQLEKNYQKYGSYCGAGNIDCGSTNMDCVGVNNLECGLYSFKDLETYLSGDFLSENDKCMMLSVDGGGDVDVSAQSYRITPYSDDCTQPLIDDVLTQE